MAIEKELNKVTESYKNEIVHIEVFLKSVEQSLTRKQKRKPITPFTKKHADQLKEFGQALENTAKQKFEPITIKASDEVTRYILQILTPMTQKELLAEMALGYLVSYTEGFIKDYLYQILLHKKEMLKGNASLSYEQILNFSSIKSLVSFIARQEVDSLGHGSVDDIATYFSKKMNIELSEYNDWETYREINYRRNILIHNRGYTNDVYCKNVGYKEKNKHLSTDHKYVSNAARIFRSFIEFVHERTLKKFKLNET